MKNLFYAALVLPLLITSSLLFAAPKKGIVISVELSPAGSFEITGRLKGSITKKGSSFSAEKLTFSVPKLKTGLELRDEHTIKYLSNSGKFKTITVVAKGKDGKGIGIAKVRGKKKKFKFTYEQSGRYIIAKFKLSLKEFGIDGISYMGIGVDDQVEIIATVPVKS
jgi:hypothetical protein